MRISLMLLLISILTACDKHDQEEAVSSLLGKWNVVELYYEEGERVELGTRPDTSFTQPKTGEFIEFISETLVSYRYSVNGEIFENEKESWTLETESTKNGFTNGKAYYINLKDSRLEVKFGDGTSDSHISATEAQILQNENLEIIGPYEIYQLTIRKE